MHQPASLAAALVIGVIVGAVTAIALRGEPPARPAPPPAPSLIPPLEDAVVGESLRLSAGADAELYRVVGATDYDVTVEVTRYHNDAPTEAPTVLSWPRSNFGLPSNTVTRSYEPDRIELGGTWYDCWRLTVYSRDSGPRLYWISNKIPVHGVLKVAGVGKGGPDEVNAARLVDWGPK